MVEVDSSPSTGDDSNRGVQSPNLEQNNIEEWMFEIHIINEKNDHIHMIEAPISYLYDFDKNTFVSSNGKMDTKKIIRWAFDFIENPEELEDTVDISTNVIHFSTTKGMRITSSFAWKNIITHLSRYGDTSRATLPINMVLRSKRTEEIFTEAGFIKTKGEKKQKKGKSKRDDKILWKHGGKEYKIKTPKIVESDEESGVKLKTTKQTSKDEFDNIRQAEYAGWAL